MQEQGQVYQLPLNIPVSNTLSAIMQELAQNGMRALIVGGSVRDAIMGYDPKDIDIEVYGTDFYGLAQVLKKYGQLANGAGDDNSSSPIVGKAFGVIKFVDPEGNDYDFSLPRRDNKTGAGHKDFDVSVDPNMSPQEAASRRDFTMNALAWDPLTQEVHDYYGGVNDIQSKTLRATSPAFAEDPLRVLRGMQFAARFGMRMDPETAETCRSIMDQYQHLPKERISEEWMKLATKGKFPGAVFDYLISTGWIDLYPRLAQMVGVPQDPEWHPEGNVETHVGHTMDSAAEVADREGLKGDDRAVLVLGLMTHDLAKSLPEHGGTTMQREKDGKMRWTSHGHEEAGGPMAQELLSSMGIKKSIIQRIVPLVQNHLQHANWKANGPSKSQLRQLSDRLHPATLQELAWMVESDASGRPPLPKAMPDIIKNMVAMAEKDGILNNRPPQMIQGRDILPYYGGKPGKYIGDITKDAYQAYLKGAFTTPEEAQLWLKNYMKGRGGIVRGEHILPYYAGKPGPHIGEVSNAAWDAQLAGEFTDEAGGNAWLQKHLYPRVPVVPPPPAPVPIPEVEPEV